MDDKLRELIVDYMNNQKLMQLATVSNGSPWVCSVWYGFDEDLNIYFFSSNNRQHSIEIESDNRVAGAMALPHTPKDTPRGLQFKGTAVKLTDKESIIKARAVYEDRIFDGETIDKLIANPDKPHFFYKITPTKFVLFDVKNYPDESRREYEL